MAAKHRGGGVASVVTSGGRPRASAEPKRFTYPPSPADMSTGRSDDAPDERWPRAAAKWAGAIMLAALGSGVWTYVATNDVDFGVEVGASVLLGSVLGLGVVALGIGIIAWAARRNHPRRVAGLLITGVALSLVPVTLWYAEDTKDFNRHDVKTTAEIVSIDYCVTTRSQYYVGTTCDVTLKFVTASGQVVQVTHNLDPEAGFDYVGPSTVSLVYDSRDPSRTATRPRSVTEKYVFTGILFGVAAMGLGLVGGDVWWTRRRRRQQAIAREAETRVEVELKRYAEGRGDTPTCAIIVRRPNSQAQWTGNESRPYRIDVDGFDRGRLKPGEATVLDLPPGNHGIQARIDWRRESQNLSINLTPGSVVWLRVGLATDAPPEHRSETPYGTRHLALYLEPQPEPSASTEPLATTAPIS